MSPGTWPGGALVPGGLRPGLVVCFFMIQSMLNLNSTRSFHLFTCKIGFAPIRELVQIFTSSSPNDEPTGPDYMNQRPATKNKALQRPLEARLPCKRGGDPSAKAYIRPLEVRQPPRLPHESGGGPNARRLTSHRLTSDRLTSHRLTSHRWTSH